MRLAVGGEDGHLLLLEIDVYAALFAEQNVLQDILGVAANTRQLGEQDGADVVGDAIFKAFVQLRPLGALAIARQVLVKNSGHREARGLGIARQVGNLAVGVLAVAAVLVVGGGNAGVDYGGVHCWECVNSLIR